MNRKAFTIVELLIVIVVIAIIAAITILAYSSTTQKATVSSIQADLTNAKKQLLAFQASSTTNSFPTAINCNNPSATEICLKPTGSNTFSYTPYTGSSPAFYLTSTNGTNTYTITESTSPLDKSSIITNGLVLNLDAGNTASYPGSGTTWTDLSGNNNNGTLVNGVAYSSANGGSLVFDGVDDRVNTGSFNLSNYSFDFFVKATGDSLVGATGYNSLIGYPGKRLLYRTDGIMLAQVGSGNVFSSSYAPRNQWNQVIFTYDSITTIGNWYINGQYAGGSSGTSTGSWNTATQIGYYGQDNYLMNGNISVVKAYSRVLSPSEISQNFNALRGRYGI